MSQLLTHRSCTPIPNTSSNTDATTGTTTATTATASTSSTMNVPTSDFMEYLPLDIRLEIYSMMDINDIKEPNPWFRYDDQYIGSRNNFSKETRKAYSLLEVEIKIAAIINDLEALQMLFPQITEPSPYQYEAARILARNGCLTALQWYCQQYDIALQGDLCACAALGGHRHIIRWILQQDRTVGFVESCKGAVAGGHLKLLIWLHENGCEWNEDTCMYAARYGRLEILKYLHENGCPWNADTCKLAAWNGDLEILQYLHENNCPWDESACSFAACFGHLEILKYLHENGCPWDEGTFMYSSDIEIRNYLREHGCPGS